MISPKRRHKKDVLVTIIVPVYNTGHYLAGCVESILRQSYKKLEVILVDDGSTDESSYVCDSFVKRDSRVKVVRQGNDGVSAARNRGMGVASGKYVTFVDADDTLLPNAIETMAILIQDTGADCVRTKCNVLQGEGSRPLSENIHEGMYRQDGLHDLIFAAATGDLLCYSWLLMVKRDVLVKGRLKFPVGVSMMEDAWFYVDLFRTIKSIYISDKVTYNYVVHDASASRSMDGFAEKVNSVVRVNRHMTLPEFTDDETRHINAINLINIASLLMVRGDRASIEDVYNMIDIVATNQEINNLYKLADVKHLAIYHQLATWAVVNDHKLVVRGLRFIRKVSGK